MKNWFTKLSTRGKVVAVIIASLLSIGTVNAITNPSQDTTQQTTPSSTHINNTKPKSTTTTKQETVTTAISFETSTVDNPSLAQGTKQVITAGQNGEKETVYEITLQNGKEISRKEISTSITKQPVTQVVHNGTQVPAPILDCPNGTYVNSAGNTVCSPYASSSAPAGATAQCVDGSYSFSQSRRGTCSRHGGVATWL